jgi:hypothetical protein
MAVLPRVPGDYGFYGFFDIRDPQALFKKLRYDYQRICAEPLNAFPVWDFFVTANHLVDWIWPSAGTAQHRQERAAETIPRICEHLANGAKHYIVNRTHAAVAQIERTGEAFAGYRSDRTEDGDALLISIDAREATELGTTCITARELARRVLIYWGRRMGTGDIPE